MPAPGGAGEDEDRRAELSTGVKRSISSCRWRSERPPTVFDWLMRHWLSSRAAFTRPNFGTAISMSKTFAVETNSGGSRRICSIETVAGLQVLLQLRALDPDVVRSLESLHSLVERPDRSLNLGLGRHHERQHPNNLAASCNWHLSKLVGHFGNGSASATPRSILDRADAEARQARAASSARTRAGASGSAKSTVPSATWVAPHAIKLERVASGLHPSHADDRQLVARRQRRRRRARPASAPVRSSRRRRARASAAAARRARGRASC